MKALYTDPSEARSLIVQVTIGCAHNTCTFCNMYKDKQFRVRKMEEIMADFTGGPRRLCDLRPEGIPWRTVMP